MLESLVYDEVYCYCYLYYLQSLNLKINGELITNKTNYMYLGLHIDSFLTFDIMSDSVCNKLRSRVALIYRLKTTVSSYCLKQLYFTFIQPYIDYCLVVWGHTTKINIKNIQRFQNRVARMITNVYDFNIPSLTLVKSLGWFNVSQRFEFLCISLIHKCIYGTAPNYLSDNITFLSEINSTETRQFNQQLLYVPFGRTTYFQKSFHVYACKLWNNLPLSLRSIDNISQFKIRYKEYILS